MTEAEEPGPPEWADQRRATLRQAAGVGLATGAYGVSYGAVGVAGGLSVLQTCALSVLMFSGASQFALVGVVSGGGGVASAAGTATLLGLRNGLYGLRLADLLGARRARRFVAAQLTIDESTAVALGQPSAAAARLGFWATGLAVFSLWNVATLLGALAGSSLGDPTTLGLDAAAPAAFVALLAPRMHGRSASLTAAVAVGVSLALVPGTPAGVPVLAAAAVAVAAGRLTPGEPAEERSGAR